MTKPFGKKSNALDSLGSKETKVKSIEKKETLFRERDVAILRGCLAGLYKKVPPMQQQKVHNALLRFASSIKDYCGCEALVHVKNEGRWACLNCGTRYATAEGGPKLVSVES